MRIFLLFLIFPFTNVWSQTLEDLEFGTEETLDIVTWNIEWFPKNDQTTLQYVVNIIESIDADIIAIQEVDDYFFFNDLVDFLADYDGYYQSSNNRGLAYLYKTDIISINSGYELFLTEPESYNFPRFPMVLDVNYYQERVVLINNHYKCCGDGELDTTDNTDEETRRYNANLLLKGYMDTELSNVKTVLLGDLNDVLTDAPLDNVFQNFIDDSTNYLFTDIDIANGPITDFSYPAWPSHLDHILINKPNFLPFFAEGGGTETIKVDDYLIGGFSEYDQNVSDHRPVGMHLVLPQVLGTTEVSQTSFVTAINPIGDTIAFQFEEIQTEVAISIYNTLGQLIISRTIKNPSENLELNSSHLSKGLYIAVITNANQERTIIKLKK